MFDIFTEFLTEFSTEFQTEFLTEFSTEFPTEFLTEFSTEFPTEFLTEFPTEFQTELIKSFTKYDPMGDSQITICGSVNPASLYNHLTPSMADFSSNFTGFQHRSIHSLRTLAMSFVSSAVNVSFI
jgi:hypothetical protein